MSSFQRRQVYEHEIPHKRNLVNEMINGGAKPSAA